MQEVKIEPAFLMELREGSPRAFRELYVKYFRMVEDLVLNLRGSSEDAKDVFQETLFVFVRKIREPEFTLSGKISTYLYAVARNIYLKKSGKYKPGSSGMPDAPSAFGFPDEEGEEISPEEKETMFAVLSEKMAALEEDCRNIIRYAFYQNLSHARIAALTGYTEAFVKVKKFRCLDYLRRMVKESDFFKNL